MEKDLNQFDEDELQMIGNVQQVASRLMEPKSSSQKLSFHFSKQSGMQE
jgi:hypothetical protein